MVESKPETAESQPEMAESETVIAEKDIPFLLENLNDYTFKWREIGIALGFSLLEIDTIDEDLKGKTSIIHLASLLNRWWQWPNQHHKEKPTLERLCKALDSTLGLGALARKLLSRRNELPSLQPKKPPTISSKIKWLIWMCVHIVELIAMVVFFLCPPHSFIFVSCISSRLIESQTPRKGSWLWQTFTQKHS